MKVLIAEYVISCYRVNDTTYNDLLPEALAMVKALERTLTHVGIDTYVSISNELSISSALFKNTVYIDPSNCWISLRKLRDSFDYVMAIAPPKELSILTEILGDKLIQQPPKLVKELSNKYSSAVLLRNCGIATPKSFVIKNDLDIHDIVKNELATPLVVKPSLLAGSECVYVIERIDNLGLIREVIDEVRGCDPAGTAVIQEYVRGIHGSVSAIYGANGPSLYSVNLQFIKNEGGRLRFVGGALPVRSPQVLRMAEQLINTVHRCFPGIRGYVGFDVVWNDTGMYVVEVNMRPTTAIVGMTLLYPMLGKHFFVSDDPLKFIGDMSPGIAYYLILSGDGGTGLKPIDLIGAPHVNKRVIIGLEKSMEDLYRKIEPILNNLIYDIKYVVK